MSDRSRKLKRVVALVIVMIFLGAFGFSVARKAQHRHLVPYLNGRDLVWESIDRVLGNIEVLQMSSGHPENSSLKNCLFEDGKCLVSSPDLQEEFFLLDNLESMSILSGTHGNPARYHETTGTKCSEDDLSCRGWLAVTSFWVDCPGKASTCSKAEKIHLRLILLPDKEGSWPVDPGTLPPLDEFYNFPDRFAYTTTLAAIDGK